jgi:hypothetical protein
VNVLAEALALGVRSATDCPTDPVRSGQWKSSDHLVPVGDVVAMSSCLGYFGKPT